MNTINVDNIGRTFKSTSKNDINLKATEKERQA